MTNQIPPSPPGPRSPLKALLSGLPTVLVLAAIAAVALWGQSTDWKAPKFAALWGGGQAAAAEDWCAEHNVPESRCIKCRPELVGANIRDWCPEHGVPESKCTICHPEILKTGVAGDWCPEHAMPESSCTLCHPEIAVPGPAPASAGGVVVSLAPGQVGPAATAPAAGHAEHGDGHDHAAHDDGPGEPAREATGHEGHGHTDAAAGGGHDHEKNPQTCQSHIMRVQFASPAAVDKAGVQLSQVVKRPMARELWADAELGYDRTKLAQISAPVAGRIWRMEKETGQPIKQGEVLALLEAAEVGTLKTQWLQAQAAVETTSSTAVRLKTSVEAGFRTASELLEAQAALKEAQIQLGSAGQALINLGLPLPQQPAGQQGRDLQFLGLPPELAKSLDPNTTTANLLPLRASFDGVVIERNVTTGEVVEALRPLLAVADIGQMWAVAHLPPADAQRIRLGQAMTFHPDALPELAARGEIAWISTAVDDQTRTVQVRAKVDNAQGRLLANTFGRAAITMRSQAAVIAVPTEAIQWEGCCHIVFVRLAPDIFQTRKVKPGAAANGYTEVTNGVLPGEVVASAGSHVLKSEILKSALGAGCADGH